MQQFAFTTGKNATDGFMIIDAMDLLYTSRFDGFCIVSSDSDFTALAIRLKEQGATVYGFGKKQTPEAFRNACSRFIYIENLQEVEPLNPEVILEKPKASAIKEIDKEVANTEIHPKTMLKSAIELPLETIKKIFEDSETEWITASLLGSQWRLLQTDFDPRTYGYKKLTDLVRSNTTIFTCEMRQVEGSENQNMYVKLKTS